MKPLSQFAKAPFYLANDNDRVVNYIRKCILLQIPRRLYLGIFSLKKFFISIFYHFSYRFIPNYPKSLHNSCLYSFVTADLVSYKHPYFYFRQPKLDADLTTE